MIFLSQIDTIALFHIISQENRYTLLEMSLSFSRYITFSLLSD